MKIIRLNGTSRTISNTENEQSNLVRRLIVTRGVEEPVEVNLREFIKTNPNMLVAGYISGLDKVFLKDKNNDASKMRVAWIRARDLLGHCLLRRLEKRLKGLGVNPADVKGSAYWKIHPYCKGKSPNDIGKINEDDFTELNRRLEKGTEKNGHTISEEKKKGIKRWINKLQTDDFRGKWFTTFTSIPADRRDYEARLFKLDFEKIADKIEHHLFEDELKICGIPRRKDPDKKWGLLEQKAIVAIASVRPNKFKPVMTFVDKDTLDYYFKEDIAAKISKKTYDDQQLNRSDAAKILAAHADKMNLKCGDIPAGLDRAKLLNLHDYVRGFYNRLTSQARVQRLFWNFNKVDKQKIDSLIPKIRNALESKLRQQEENKLINHLIAHGKILHYSGENVETRKYFRSSDGQAYMKRVESLARIMRTTTVHLHRSCAKMALPALDYKVQRKNSEEPLRERQGKIVYNDDILSSDIIKEAAGDKFQANLFVDHADLLFGDDAIQYMAPKSDKDKQKWLCYSFLTLARLLRNNTVHFKSREEMLNALCYQDLHSSLKDVPPSTWQDIRGLMARDKERRKGKVQDSLKGMFADFILKEDEFVKFVDHVTQETADNEGAFLALPKFSKLIDRYHNLEENCEGELPQKPDATEKQTGTVAACQYGLIKILYGVDFRNWVSDEKRLQQLKTWFDTTVTRTTQRARDFELSGDLTPAVQGFLKTINAAAHKLPFASSLAETFSSWDRIVTTEIREEKSYKANESLSRTKAKWLENCRIDLLSHAFVEFLKSHEFSWLLHMGERNKNNTANFTINQTVAEEFPANTDEIPQWQANLYLLCHGVPSDTISQFVHQLRKTQSLERKQGEASQQKLGQVNKTDEAPDTQNLNKQLAELICTLELYLDMADYKYSGAPIDKFVKEYEALYEDTSSFRERFDLSNDGDELTTNLQKELRQIMRFGDITVLKKISKFFPVTQNVIEDLDRLEQNRNGDASDIAKAQKKRKELHSIYVDADPGLSEEELEEYSKVLTTIIKHKK